MQKTKVNYKVINGKRVWISKVTEITTEEVEEKEKKEEEVK